MKKNGFTLAELIIVVAIIGILAAVAIPAFKGRFQTKCINGYTFTNNSHPVQILDDQGHGMKCD